MKTSRELMQLMLAHRAAAQALETELKERAVRLWDAERIRASWDVQGVGQVITQLAQPRAEVYDMPALIEWLKVHYAHQVQQVTVVRNEKWLKEALLTTFVPYDAEPDSHPAGAPFEMVDPQVGTVVPGVRYQPGGGLHGVSIRPDSSTVKELLKAAQKYVEGAAPMPGLPMIAGETHDHG